MSVHLSLAFHSKSQTIAMIPSVSVRDSHTHDRERMTGCPLEMQQALTLNHLPGIHPAKVSLFGDVRENLATHRGEGKAKFSLPPSTTPSS